MKTNYGFETTDINKLIGKKIAQLRKHKGYTQQQLADTIGTKRYIIANYEQGRARIFGEMVYKIAIVLGTTADEIMGFKDLEAKEAPPSYSIKQQWDKVKALSPEKQERMARIIKQGLKKLQAD